MSVADFSTPLPGSVQQTASVGQGGSALSNLIELLKGFISPAAWASVASRIQFLAGSFFNPREFSRPASQAEWVSRVTANASHFKLIYGLFFLPLLLQTMLSSFWLQMGSIALICVWGYGYGIKKEESSLPVFGVPFPKVIVCASTSVVVMLITGMLNALLYAIFLFAVIGMPHLSLHNLPVNSAADALDAVEMQAFNVPS